MGTLVDAKRAFYRDERVAGTYDRQRFGGASGAYVNERELTLIAALLPERLSTIADVGSGTGRLLPILSARARRVLALDASLAMLREARPKAAEPQLVQADAFALPLRDGALDAATCMRVLFHFDDVRPLLRELRRVVGPNGALVCDTTTWSPRGLLPLGRRLWGERVAAKTSRRFRALAREAGWTVEEERACFLVSPYLYRRAPLRLAMALERLEARLPERLLCRRFWRLRARSESSI
jgi:ubiquinone/menaquinone biosynthesis C-methylase UbiE